MKTEIEYRQASESMTGTQAEQGLLKLALALLFVGLVSCWVVFVTQG